MSSQNIGYNELSRNKFFCLTKLLRDLNHSIEIFQVCEYEFDECLGLGDFSNSVFFPAKKSGKAVSGIQWFQAFLCVLPLNGKKKHSLSSFKFLH